MNGHHLCYRLARAARAQKLLVRSLLPCLARASGLARLLLRSCSEVVLPGFTYIGYMLYMYIYIHYYI